MTGRLHEHAIEQTADGKWMYSIWYLSRKSGTGVEIVGRETEFANYGAALKALHEAAYAHNWKLRVS